ncbi:hypothetical protein [Streptomyces sp. NBC_01619]|uniref:hypothetical protein n=1 Tax=Streptomyces sp. NBC_01619 TaxID=2975901 RepID=UPI00224CFBD2|nr:hypothetical protein [Streptomyces sp. NBC_01619]
MTGVTGVTDKALPELELNPYLECFAERMSLTSAGSPVAAQALAAPWLIGERANAWPRR